VLRSAFLVTCASCAILPGAASAQEAIPTIEAVGVSPVPGGEIDRDKVPSNVQTVGPSDLDHSKTSSLLDGMVQSLPGVSLSDQSGNAFQRNLDYRGFTASPVPGTPQGIAVYQNGTRINEAFGDVVNWDFIPEMAIARMTLMPNNPLFGLNATGGAMSIEMKNGFTYQGTETELRGGSFGRLSGAVQSGYQKDNVSAYVAADATTDKGWRDFSSSSVLRRIYADVGVRGDETEFHVSFTGADNKLGAVAATPIEMLNQRWSSVFTWPQTTHLQLAFLQTTAKWTPTDTLTLDGNAYFRAYRAAHVDGNNSGAQPCDGTGTDPNALFGEMCIGDPQTPLNQNMPVLNTLADNSALGEIDRNWTSTNSYGGSLQATSTAQWFGHDNHLVVGTSIDHGNANFRSSSELGTVDQNFFVTGTGVFIDQPLADVTPVNLGTSNTYVGVYATDTFDITRQLSVTAGGRYNYAQINLQDLTGNNPLLTSNNNFQRFNPVIGLTYKFTPNITGYAGYSEANRAPTPLELGCSDPQIPCQIDNFLIADPPLKQVVSHTIEGGLRGEFSGGGHVAELVTKAPKKAEPPADDGWRLRWGVSLFRTENTDDIINIASTAVQGFGYFQNAGTTLREGVEANVNLSWNRWNAYANYTFIDATYQSFLTLNSPNNPMAVNGLISVVPGDHIPGIPAQRFKIGAEYQITDAWKLGADANFVGSQWLIHDDSNLNAKVPSYWVVNMHTSYQLTKNIEFFGLVQNLFNQHYYSAGTFFDSGGFTNSTLNNPSLMSFNDPRTFIPGMPLAVYAGIKATF
jgi:iron complex outermembrane receptor protein